MADSAHTIGSIAAIAAACMALLGLATSLAGPDQIPKELHMPVRAPALALELARTPDGARNIADRPGSAWRTQMRSSLRVDFELITAYTTFFVALGFLMRATTGSSLGWLAVVAGIVAAGADVLENVRLLGALGAPDAELPRLLVSARIATLVKWSAYFAAIAALSPMFYGDGWVRLVTFAGAPSAVIGIAGVALTACTSADLGPRAIQLAMRLSGFLPVAVVILWVSGRRLPLTA